MPVIYCELEPRSAAEPGMSPQFITALSENDITLLSCSQMPVVKISNVLLALLGGSQCDDLLSAAVFPLDVTTTNHRLINLSHSALIVLTATGRPRESLKTMTC